MFQPGGMLERKRISAPGRSGKDEAVQALVRGQRAAAADHVADVLLGQLVVGEVERRRSRGCSNSRGEQRRLGAVDVAMPTKTCATFASEMR